MNRGVAVWGGMVYVGTLDGRLVAIDAVNGTLRWSVDTFIDDAPGRNITGAPQGAVKGRVLIGNGGADMSARGYVSAYDARSGTLAWRFFTVPATPHSVSRTRRWHARQRPGVATNGGAGAEAAPCGTRYPTTRNSICST